MSNNITGKFDRTASFFAVSSSKLGKKEITISPITKNELDEFLVVESLETKFEVEEEVINFEWIYIEEKTSGKSKRRLSSNGNSAHSNKSASYLVVALKPGKILIFSPFKKEIVNEIDTDFEITAITSDLNSFWVSNSKKADQYFLNDTKPKNSILFPKHYKATSILALKYNSQAYLLVGGKNKLAVIDQSDNKLFAEFIPETESKHQITSIICKNEIILTTKANSNIASAFSLISREPLFTLNASNNIISLFIIENTVGALTKNGSVELFSTALLGKSTDVTSIISTNATQIKFLDAISYNSKLLLSWIDIIPKFKLISTKGLPLNNEIDVQFVYKQEYTNKKVLEPITDDLEPVENYKVREIELVALIEAKLSKPIELLKVLVSNEEQDKIKYAVSQLSNGQVLRIFKILSPRIELDPTESSALNTWLKWVIIRHTQGINDTSDLKTLKNNFRKEIKQLPNLLKLQGKLELLRSQLQLRSEISAGDVQEVEIPSDLISKAEEKIVYINGENDDGDDIIEAAGNSQSEDDEDEGEDNENEDEDEDEDSDNE